MLLCLARWRDVGGSSHHRPSFWRALGWVVWDLFFIGWNALGLIGLVSIVWLCMICGPIQCASLTWFSWPKFRFELNRWRRDD